MNNSLSLLILSLIIHFSSNAQNFPWNAFFGNEGAEFAYDIKQTSDDGYIVAAYGSDGGSSDFYVVKLDAFGSLVWERNISKDNYSERAFNVLETAEGEYVVVGNATNFNKPWLVKLDPSGDTLWTSQWTDNVVNNSGLLARGALLSDGRIAVMSHEGYYALDPYMFIVSNDGELLEERDLEPLVPLGWYSGTVINDVESTTDGGFVLTGATGGGPGSRGYLWKFDANADSVWSVIYDGDGMWMRTAQSVKQLSDGGYVLVGSNGPNTTATAAIRTDENGNFLWYQEYPDTLYTNGTDVIEWHSGEFLITEKRFSGFGTSFFETAMVRIDSLGNLLSRDLLLASDSSTTINQVRRTNDGGFVMAGEINEYLSVGEQDLFVLKSDSLGNIDNVFIDYVWPGDVDYNGTVDMDDLMIIGVTAGATGPGRVDTTLGWYPHYVTDWADTVVTGVNFKHADTDGNGIVEIEDTLAISLNFGLNHVIPSKSSDLVSGPALYIVPDEAVLADEMHVHIPVYLGTGNWPLESFYGLRFQIQAESSLINAEQSTFSSYPESWITGGDANAFLDLVEGNGDVGVLMYGFTRINHEETSGYGQIGTLILALDEGVGTGWDDLTFDLSFENAAFSNYNLEMSGLDAQSYTVTVTKVTTALLDVRENDIDIYPNPVEGTYVYIAGLEDLNRVSLVQADGSVQPLSFESNKVLLPEGIQPGLYILRIDREEASPLVKKVVIR